MPESALRLPPIQFPIIGNSAVVGLFSLLHLFLAGLSVGFIVLAPYFEYLGMRDPLFTRLAKTLVQFVAVIFSLSATFAVVMLELFVGLFPVSTVYIFRRFEFPIYVAIAVFFLHIFSLYTYWYRWEKMREKSVRRHIGWGVAAALFILIWGGLLDGIGSYMLTPTERDLAGISRFSTARFTFLLNPTWAPLVLHRFFGSLIVSFYAIGLYGGWKLIRRPFDPAGESAEEAYYRRVMRLGMIVGTGLLLVQPIAGMLYSVQIRRANPQAIERLLFGPAEWLVRLQFLLVGLLFVLSNRFLATSSPAPLTSRRLNLLVPLAAVLMVAAAQQVALRRGLMLALIAITFYHLGLTLLRGRRPPAGRADPWLAVSVGACAMATFLLMGVIREQGRRPYTVYGQIHLQDEKQPLTEFVRR